MKDTYLFELSHNAGDGAVSNEDSATDLDTGGQVRVRAGDLGVVTLDSVIGSDFQGLVFLELNVLAIDEHTSTDLGSLGVEQKSDVLIRALGKSLIEALDLLTV